jgi:septum formation inhibitor MinC
MTDEQIKQSIAQGEQDSITLDFSKWSAQRIQAKLPNDHSLWRQERDRTLARQQSENAEARRRHLAKLDDDRKAKQAETDALTELQLAPEKRRLQNEWLANNPGQTAADFDKKAWHLLKENLIEQKSADIMNATIQSQKASGRYSL